MSRKHQTEVRTHTQVCAHTRKCARTHKHSLRQRTELVLDLSPLIKPIRIILCTDEGNRTRAVLSPPHTRTHIFIYCIHHNRKYQTEIRTLDTKCIPFLLFNTRSNTKIHSLFGLTVANMGKPKRNTQNKYGNTFRVSRRNISWSCAKRDSSKRRISPLLVKG